MTNDSLIKMLDCEIDALVRQQFNLLQTVKKKYGFALPYLYPLYRAAQAKTLPCVYFVYCKELNLTKIGCTTDLKKRLKSLRAAAEMFGFSMELIGYVCCFEGSPYTLESKYHQRFAKFHKFSEWFDLKEGDMNSIGMLRRSPNDPLLVSPYDLDNLANLSFEDDLRLGKNYRRGDIVNSIRTDMLNSHTHREGEYIKEIFKYYQNADNGGNEFLSSFSGLFENDKSDNSMFYNWIWKNYEWVSSLNKNDRRIFVLDKAQALLK